MRDRKFIGAKFVSYYNLIVSACFIIGPLALIWFSWKTKPVATQNSLIPLLFLIVFGVFCCFSALKYLRHEKVGRTCLIVCFIVQILFSVHGLISTYRVTASLPFTNVIMLIVGIWGTWYLTTRESKEWLNSFQDSSA